jgi:UDP-2-acetamido-3-amino-2,3-dideoxy-glucuronate N-acetyltransferase
MNETSDAEQTSGERSSDIFVHPAGILESRAVGAGTRIWAFAHVLPGAVLGRDVNVCDHVFIENDVVVGDRVTIKSGVALSDGLRVEDDVIVGANVSFTTDPLIERSEQDPPNHPHTILRRGSSLGAGAVLLPGLTVGARAMIDAGAVVTRDVPPHAIVTGNPAYITGYVGADRSRAASPHTIAVSSSESHPIERVSGVKLLTMPKVDDLRGMLSFGEVGQHLPFVPKRYFIVYDVATKEVRGEHAHKRLHQLLLCVRGSVSIVVDDGRHRGEVALDTPELGLYIPAGIWGTQYKYTRDAILLVLASDVYQAEDYIREYDEFERYVADVTADGSLS